MARKKAQVKEAAKSGKTTGKQSSAQNGAPEYDKYRAESSADLKPVKLIKMQRADGKTADVHPDMIEHYRKGGYAEV